MALSGTPGGRNRRCCSRGLQNILILGLGFFLVMGVRLNISLKPPARSTSPVALKQATASPPGAFTACLRRYGPIWLAEPLGCGVPVLLFATPAFSPTDSCLLSHPQGYSPCQSFASSLLNFKCLPVGEISIGVIYLFLAAGSLVAPSVVGRYGPRR